MVACLRTAVTASLVLFAFPVFAGPHHSGGGHASGPAPKHQPPAMHAPIRPPHPQMRPPVAQPVPKPVAMPIAPVRPIARPFGPGYARPPIGERPQRPGERVYGGFYPYPVYLPGPPQVVDVPDPEVRLSRRAARRAFIAAGGNYAPYGGEVATPYAPPVFHIIGAPSSRHMARTVHLVHGVQAGPQGSLDPKVIWLEKPPKAPRHVKSGG
jgi:hypothetical protein